MRHTLPLLGIGLGLLASSFATVAQQGPPATVGEFTGQTDVGNPALKGSAVYDAGEQRYTVSGAGMNMWFGTDEFHFVWKRIRGDFIVQTRAGFPEKGVDPHRKLGWMARSTLETGSPHVNAAVHGDGLTSLQFRRTPGAATENPGGLWPLVCGSELGRPAGLVPGAAWLFVIWCFEPDTENSSCARRCGAW